MVVIIASPLFYIYIFFNVCLIAGTDLARGRLGLGPTALQPAIGVWPWSGQVRVVKAEIAYLYNS